MCGGGRLGTGCWANQCDLPPGLLDPASFDPWATRLDLAPECDFCGPIRSGKTHAEQRPKPPRPEGATRRDNMTDTAQSMREPSKSVRRFSATVVGASRAGDGKVMGKHTSAAGDCQVAEQMGRRTPPPRLRRRRRTLGSAVWHARHDARQQRSSQGLGVAWAGCTEQGRGGKVERDAK